MTDTETIVGGFKITLLAEIVRTIAKGVLIVVLARFFLTPNEYGLLFLAISVFGIVMLFSQLGIAKSAARYIAEYQETGPEQIYHIVRKSLLYSGVAMVIVATGVAVFHQPIANVFNESELAPLLLIGFVYIIVRTLSSHFQTLFQGFNLIAWSAKVSIVSNVGIFVFVLLFMILGLGPLGALSGYIVGYAAGAVIGFILLRRLLQTYDRTSSMERGLARRIWEYSIPLTATKGANVLYKRVDTVLIGIFLNPVAVGFYTLAKQLSGFVIAPANSLGFAVSPSYGEHKAADELQRAARIYESTFKYTILFYIPAAVGLVIVADPAVRFVFGPDYLDAVPIIQVFSLFIVLQAVDKMTNDALDYLGRARQRAIAKGGTGILNFILNLVLIPMIGAVGAAISTVICFAIMVAINIYLIHIELSLSIDRIGKILVVVCAIAAGMGTAVIVVQPFVTDLLTLFGTVLFGGIVWLLLSLSVGLIDRNQIVTHLR